MTAMPTRATVATASRAKDSPIGPNAGAATRIAGKALAHSSTTPWPATSARLTVMPRC
jgi:hypothetical protein